MASRKMTSAFLKKEVLPGAELCAEESGWKHTGAGDFCIERPNGMIDFFHVSPASGDSVMVNIGLVNRHLNETALGLVGETGPKSPLKHLRLAFGCNLSRLTKNIPVENAANVAPEQFGRDIFGIASKATRAEFSKIKSVDDIEAVYTQDDLSAGGGAPLMHLRQVAMTIALWKGDVRRAEDLVSRVYETTSQGLLTKTIWEAAKDYLSRSENRPLLHS